MKTTTSSTANPRRVKIGGTSARRVDPATIAQKLGATVVSAGPSPRQSPVGLMALRNELFARLASSGGRPGLAGATRRQKVPLSDSDWRQLEQLSGELRRTDLHASPGQVASMLLHTALRLVQVDPGSRGLSEIVDADPNSEEGSPPRLRVSTSTHMGSEPRASQVVVKADALIVDLIDGRTIIAPLAWFPRLMHGTPAERSRWLLLGDGIGIHWPDLDEDISVEGLLRGGPSMESPSSLQRWLDSRSRPEERSGKRVVRKTNPVPPSVRPEGRPRAGKHV
jgi:hypothetical protein